MAANETPNPAAPAATPAGAPAASSGRIAAAPQQPMRLQPSKASSAAEKAKKALSNLKNLGASWRDIPKSWSLILLLRIAEPAEWRGTLFSASPESIGVLISQASTSTVRDERKLSKPITDTGEQGKNLGEFIKKQAEEAKSKFSTQSLGTFTIELKARQDADGNTPKRRQA